MFSGIIAVGISICIFIYTLTGAFGYLNFEGHCYNSDILRNYCPRDIYIDVARGLLAVVMVTSYPIPAYCGRCVCVCVCVGAENRWLISYLSALPPGLLWTAC